MPLGFSFACAGFGLAMRIGEESLMLEWTVPPAAIFGAMSAGNAAVVREELERVCERDHVHGAYLFHGAPGTGKERTARWFAGRLLGRDWSGDEEETWHPDLHVVEPDGAVLKIDQVRELQRALSLLPNEGGRRVALLFGVERIRLEAANALLKTLEEPPRDTTIVLVTSQPGTLPPTLISRTTRYRFLPMAEHDVEQVLLSEGFEPDDAWLAAVLGGGSPEAAREWADEHLESARDLCAALAEVRGWSASEVLEFAESFRGGGEKLRKRAELFLDVHAAFARRAVEAAARDSDRATVERWVERAEAGANAHRELVVRNLNPQLVVEGLMLDLRG
jgi:DNA polymerase-3 subunit delta'